MGLLGIIGIFIGASAALITFRRLDGFKLGMFVFLYGVHIAAMFAYWAYTKTTSADSHGYYFDPFRIGNSGFGIGTDFIYFVVQGMRDMFGASYLDCFFLFQAFGFIGIAILLRIFEEIYFQYNLPTPMYVYAVVSLPSLHFWSSAIGKDAPLLLGVSLLLWSTMRVGQRIIWLIFAIFLILLIKPHVAVVAAAALTFSFLLGRGVSSFVRVLLFVAASGATILSAAALNAAYDVDVASVSSISQQYDRIGSVLKTDDSGNTAVTGNLIVRLASLLFRPLFFDAQNSLAVASSPENLLILMLFVSVVVRSMQIVFLFRRSLFIRVAVIFSIFITTFLTLSYFNVGLGLRQKWVMLMPAALSIYVALNAMRSANAAASRRIAVARRESHRLARSNLTPSST